MKVQSIEISKIKTNPKQPRKEFGDLAELKDSLKVKGLLQPIIVNKDNVIVAGERRFKACCELGWEEIDAIVKDVDELTSDEISLIENWHRKDLTSEERENMIYSLWASRKYLSQIVMAKSLGIDESVISRNIKAKKLRLVGKENCGAQFLDVSTDTISNTEGLPEKERIEIMEDVEKGELSPKAVREEVKLRKLAKENPKIAKDDYNNIISFVDDTKKILQQTINKTKDAGKKITILSIEQKKELKDVVIETIAELTVLVKHL